MWEHGAVSRSASSTVEAVGVPAPQLELTSYPPRGSFTLALHQLSRRSERDRQSEPLR